MNDANDSHGSQIDWFIFIVGTVLLAAVVIPIVVAPEWSFGVINASFQFITNELGVYYVWAACITFIFLVWLSISRFGGIVLGPFVGMFVSKISRGRTIREVIFGMLGFGSLGCALFFIVLGNYALDLELSGAYPVAEQALGESPSTAIAAIIDMLPFGKFWLAFIAVVGIIFTATTYDSASYTLSAGATRYLKADEHPLRFHRVYWAIALGTLPSVLLFLGGLTALQTASVVASVPLLFVYVLLAWSIVKTLQDYQH